MSVLNQNFQINQYQFDNDLIDELDEFHFAKEFWPIVYILTDDMIKEAYVGETADTYMRMKSHLKNDDKSRLTIVHLIGSHIFNKSATLDIESNLIKYLTGDGQYKLQNANLGLANHEYYQKNQVYWELFKSLWDNLRSKGLSKHSLEFINNSDLFKYSPYKSLTNDQRDGLMIIIDNLLNDRAKHVIIEGGAGTGKTILAIFLFKLLTTDSKDFNFTEFGDEESEFIEKIIRLKNKFWQPKIALVVPMSSFRKTLKKVFKNIKGLSSSMVIGPAEVTRNNYDILIVDESHRLRRRVNLGAYFGAFDRACEKLNLDKVTCSEVDFVLSQSKKNIFFYDENQSIKPSDVEKFVFDKLKLNPDTNIDYLKSQFRVKGGNAYVKFVDNLLKCNTENLEGIYNSKNYDLILFRSLSEMIEEIKEKNNQVGLSRLIAGYSWPWISKKDKGLFDIKIDNVELQWNGENIDWINSPNSVNEVGCIHTTQGYDLNYSGIIFGNEITYNTITKRIEIIEENYFDKYGKQSVKSHDELSNFIENIYKTILLRAIRGTYIYVCDENLRNYFSKFIKTRRFEEYKDEVELFIESPELKPFVNAVPFFDLKVAAGEFSENQNVEDLKWIKSPKDLKISDDYFACEIEGESMNKVIPNGSICGFKKYKGGTRNGKIVLIQSTSIQDSDFGSGYTIKEYLSIKKEGLDNWSHESIILRPLSDNPNYKDIKLFKDELQDFKVIGVFDRVLYT